MLSEGREDELFGLIPLREEVGLSPEKAKEGIEEFGYPTLMLLGKTEEHSIESGLHDCALEILREFFTPIFIDLLSAVFLSRTVFC